jgi:hypothetical protein
LLPVVGRLIPFQVIAEVDRKPLPFTVSVKDGPPTVAFFGEIEEIVGAVLPPPVAAELPEFPGLPELWEFPEPPEEQFTSEIRTAAAETIRHKREIWVEAFTRRYRPEGVGAYHIRYGASITLFRCT